MATDLNTLSLPDLYRALSQGGLTRRLLDLARDEDLGLHSPAPRPGEPSQPQPIGDITSMACIAPNEMGTAALVARSGGVLAGLEAIPDILAAFSSDCTFMPHARDGDHVPPRSTIAQLAGPTDEILEVERTLLNLLGRLGGIATKTSQLAAAIAAVKGSRAQLFDTRKTTPGLRAFEKYAVRCGGGRCHRLGLFDAVLLKDNHLAGTSVADLPALVHAAADRARKVAPAPISFIEVEVDTLDQFEALLTLPKGTIDIVLLDNMGPDKLRAAAARRDAVNPTLQLEASGGITLDTISAIAATGVDRISTGSITHSAVSLDVALDIVGTSRGR